MTVRKPEMVQFLNDQAETLHKNDVTLISTGTTGAKVEKAGFKVTKFLSGPIGGHTNCYESCGKANVTLLFSLEIL